MNQEKISRKHAVVIGGGISGLLAARVLAGHFEKVTVFEKDNIPTDPDFRKGVPHDRQPHLMNTKGEMIISKYFPGFYEEIDKEVDEEIARLNTESFAFFQNGCWKVHCKTRVDSHLMSRPFLEYHVRRRLQDFQNIHFLQGHHVDEWVIDKVNNRVKGISFKNQESRLENIQADLFVDASGRGSRMPKWLESNGYGILSEEKVEVNVAYLSQIFPRSQKEDFTAILIYPTAPEDTRMGVIFPMEANRWHVSMVGLLGDHPKISDDGLKEFAKSLTRPDIYDAIHNLTPLSPVSSFRFPANVRRYYERMAKLPDNLIAIGDAVCSFNPIYGQGMSVAAMESEALDVILSRKANSQHFSKYYFKKIKKIINNAWMASIGEDLRYPLVKGKRSLMIKFSHWYLAQLFELSSFNAKICGTFFEVQMCIEKPTKLFKPSIFFKVIQHSLGLTGTYKPNLERPKQKNLNSHM
ncbi:MAG: monooxygenase FAD-binding protein [Bacilli bacterium]|nr:monooxygenase FAD-binding protein [Bacilli bacterium]